MAPPSSDGDPTLGAFFSVAQVPCLALGNSVLRVAVREINLFIFYFNDLTISMRTEPILHTRLRLRA